MEDIAFKRRFSKPEQNRRAYEEISVWYEAREKKCVHNAGNKGK